MQKTNWKKINLIIGICGIIFAFLGGTFAYFRWITSEDQKTNIVLTVESTFKCEVDGGGNITEEEISLVPTDCTNSTYAIKREVKVTPTIYGEYSVKMDLWLDINEIGTGLSGSDNFKYAITTDPNSCTNGLIKSGNFKAKKKGNSVELFNQMGYNLTTTDTYYLYVWLDKAETSMTTADQSFDFSLNGKCESGPNPESYLLYNLIKEYSVPDNISSKYVSNSDGIDFGSAAGDTNGKGIYTVASTLNNEYPIHYYRGPIENNNVLFANLCWKIVRTTETGGTKLIYNGPPNNGKCNNTGDVSQLPTKSAFNSSGKVEAAGYSYGKIHGFKTETLASIPNGTIFSNNITYDATNGKYILNNERYIKDSNITSSNLNDTLKNYHYTCLTTDENACTNTIYFAYMSRGTSINFIQLTNGETIENLIEYSFNNSTNTTSSSIKKVVDAWYEQKMTPYTQFLEDTVWCNDKSIHSANGWTRNGSLSDVTEDKLNFGAQYRLVYNKEPSLLCQNYTDRFTVSPENGNGALTYPSALITLDEAALAGYVWFEGSDNNYLNNDKIWWTMTPTIASANLLYVAILYSIADNVSVNYTNNGAGGVRPMISLKHDMTIKSGYGTVSQPYVIDQNTYVDVSEVFDSTSEIEDKLHIGDFVNYDAGTWTQTEINNIKVGPTDALVSPNNSLELPKSDYQFGGFTSGTSRNSTSKIAQFNGLGTVKYIYNAANNTPISGWRVFDINETTGEVTLISAGNPEAFFQAITDDGGYSTPYIFSGTIHSDWGENNAVNYQKRSWDMYINKSQGATSAYILSKSDLEAWYDKYIGSSGDLWTQSNFQQIYAQPRLHNIIDNNSFWWLSSTRAAAGPHFVQGDDERRLRGGNGESLGIRINVVLSNNAKFSETKVGTIELTSEHLTPYGGNQIYNVWDLKNNNS